MGSVLFRQVAPLSATQCCHLAANYSTISNFRISSTRRVPNHMTTKMAAAPTFIPAEQVYELLDQEELLKALENAFGNFSLGPDGGVVQPMRSVIEVTRHKGFFGVMSAYSDKDEAMATKILSFYPENKDGSSHVAQVLLFDPTNGTLQAILDGDSITAIRTAVASAVASKHLSNPNSKVLAIIGSGVQARSHYRALCLLHKYDEVRVWSKTREYAQKFASDIGARCCATPEEAVTGADIICTTTVAHSPFLKLSWIKEGAHINAVGACRPDWNEIDPDLMRAATVYVDSKESCMKESGDIILSGAEIFGEIGEIINGSKQAHWEKTTIFKSVGIALEDVVSAKLVYNKYKTKYSK